MAADFLNGNPNRKQKIRFYILSVKHKALNVCSQWAPGLSPTDLKTVYVQLPPNVQNPNALAILWAAWLCGFFYLPFLIACFIIWATVSGFMPRSLQYLDWNQSDSRFCPLLALHPRQQRTMFSLVIIFASLIICSQLAADFADIFAGVNSTPQ